MTRGKIIYINHDFQVYATCVIAEIILKTIFVMRLLSRFHMRA